MNRQKFLAELSRLLGFMSSWDREAEMNKYIEMFDAHEDEAALIESLGTPTQIAISVALGYKSTPRPGTQPPEPEPEPEPAEGQAGAGSEPSPEPEPPPPPKKKRGEDEIVTDSAFDYGMELALLMGEPVAAAVESAFRGEYLPDPELSLDEILREARGGKEPEAADEAKTSEPEEAAEAGAEPASEEAGEEPAAEAVAAPEAEPAAPEAASGEEDAPPEPSPEAAADAAEPESASGEEDLEAAPEAAAAEPETAENGPEAKPREEDAAEAGTEDAPGDVPVFDSATAPLPEAVKSAESGEESADAPDAGAKHPPHLVFDPANFAPLPEDKSAEDGEAEEGHDAQQPRRTRRPLGTAVYVLFLLAIGIPLALLLILIGVPVMLSGLGILAGTAYAATHIIAALSMFSDILLVVGAGLGICGVGLLIAWLGLWLSIELGSLWINAVIMKLGRALCFKREADVQ